MAGVPIVTFAILVGLSMDYEVLMLSRIGEAYRRHGDNTRAVGGASPIQPASSVVPH